MPPAAAATVRRLVVRPRLLDLRTASPADMRSALDEHSMFFVHRHGLELLYRAARVEASGCGVGETADLTRTTPDGVQAGSAWSQLRFGLAALGAQIVAAVAGERRLGLAALRERGGGDGDGGGGGGGGSSVTASLTLRRYPADGRLGAHTDANLLTMLWADHRGLQVYRPPEGQAPEAAVLFGLPRTDVAVEESASVVGGAEGPCGGGVWLTVALPEKECPAEQYPLLVTLGAPSCSCIGTPNGCYLNHRHTRREATRSTLIQPDVRRLVTLTERCSGRRHSAEKIEGIVLVLEIKSAECVPFCFFATHPRDKGYLHPPKIVFGIIADVTCRCAGSAWFDKARWGTSALLPPLPDGEGGAKSRARPVLHRVDVADAAAAEPGRGARWEGGRDSLASLVRVLSGEELEADPWACSKHPVAYA